MYRAQAFRATVTAAGDRAVVVVPFDPDRVWGPRGLHAVTGTIDGCPWSGTLERLEGRFAVALGAVTGGPSEGFAIGATVDVVLAAEDPRPDNVAPDVAAALASDPAARSFFEGLAGYYRRNFIRAIEGAKRPATRAARIAEMMALLRERRREK